MEYTIRLQNLEDKKKEKLTKRIRALGFAEKDLPSILYHIDKLSNIIINSYISSKEKSR